ncbi:angiotensin-converting enzyme-like, partial [Anneissia japonica]|uniref:angiotensin-converting enzyme-like n=1 Tax=Anneissia japonica TaxID=1529436 RepID=UPI0014256E61
IQFQFYEAMCNAANHTGPLYKCDFYESKEAGQLLGNMLALGRSKPWPEAMEAITGQREMSAEPLLRYFESLKQWLEKENERNNEYIGWEKTWRPYDVSASFRLVPLGYSCFILFVLSLIFGK